MPSHQVQLTDEVESRKQEAKTVRVRPRVSEEIMLSVTNPTDLLVVKMLQKYGPKTRSQLVKVTGIPRSTLFDSLSRIQILGLVTKFTRKASSPGRPKVLFCLVEDLPCPV